nr:MAG: hypothetical protein EDM05_29620 [Leptolyngbya sp. IPPAS B-1204]
MRDDLQQLKRQLKQQLKRGFCFVSAQAAMIVVSKINELGETYWSFDNSSNSRVKAVRERQWQRNIAINKNSRLNAL